MRIVRNYPLGDSCWYLEELGLQKPYNKLTPPVLPVIVTGASSNHFLESQAFLYSIKTTLMKNYEVPKLIYYDLGLDISQRKELEEYCDCDIRNFPFHKFPSHVKNLQGYAWKPLIIQTILNEYGYVLWLDTSIRFIKTSLFQDLMRNVDRYGVASFDFNYTIGDHIDPESLEFLGEDPCLFANISEPSGGGVIIRRSNFTLEYIMRPWVSCALSFGCMVNDRSGKLGGCPDKPSLGSCHRFDQSVLGIILWRLYGRKELVVFPEMLVTARRGHEMNYFHILREEKLKSTMPKLALNTGAFTYRGIPAILLLINRLIQIFLLT
ncbi:hypothetical protein CHS0354_031077 [Potamilus streckersoni]|uniref:Uncharacterized protein n=1 Tax=Potamilus streckersoni TaxID=2493646 RepID=A0AAE0S006_9BIVA|nr:hypothetical protein CHS0354_031077 [Potamilus streckersoni]